MKTNKIDLNKKLFTVTCNRREKLGENMEKIFLALKEIVENHENVQIVYPVHLNPKVRETANKIFHGIQNVHLIEPLEYQPFVKLMSKSYMIITDSGGMQEEAPSLGKPVLVVRKETERPEAISAGTIKLAGVEKDSIYQLAKELLEDPQVYDSMAKATNPYGDGTTSQQIIAALKKELLE